MAEKLQFLSAVLMVSEQPERLAKFYQDVLGVPLEAEQHGDTKPHWGATLGQLHFAIHPVEDFPDGKSGVGALKLAFNVFDIEGLVARLQEKGVEVLYPVKDTGFFLSTAILDPDGNFVELTQMCDDWFNYLEERHQKGIDIIQQWKEAKQEPKPC